MPNYTIHKPNRQVDVVIKAKYYAEALELADYLDTYHNDYQMAQAEERLNAELIAVYTV